MSRKKWFFLWIVVPIVIAGVLLFLSIHYFFDPRLYSNTLQKTLTQHLGREVTFGKAKIGFWGGIGIAFEDFRIKGPPESPDLFQARRLILTAKLLPLLNREVRWKRITLDRPKIFLSRDRSGRFHFLSTSSTQEESTSSRQKVIETLSTLFGGSLSIRSGEVSFSDGGVDGPPLLTEVRSFDLRLSDVSFHRPFLFRMSGKILQAQKEALFALHGTIENISEEMDLQRAGGKVEVEVKGIEILHFWPYLKTILPMERIAGTLDLKGRYQGGLSDSFKTSGRIQIRNLVYDHPKVFAYLFTPKWLNLDFQAEYDKRSFSVPRFSIELPEIKIKGRGNLYGIGTKEMGMDAEASSDPFDLAEGRRFIPFRIITPDVSELLFRSAGNGPVQILSVKLSGKMPEIEHCDQPQNAHTLTVEMRLNGVHLKLPWNVPALEGMKGNLLFKGGHLNLKEVEGRVLRSSIERAHGVFQNLLRVPVLEIHSEGRLDLADLPVLVKSDAFDRDSERAFESVTSLSGRAQYRFFLNGRLTAPLDFKHQGSYHLSRVRLVSSRIPFPVEIEEGKVDFSGDDLRWTGATVESGNSSLLTSGSWKKGGATEITANGKVDLKSLFVLSQSPLFAQETRSTTGEIKGLSGTGHFSIKAKKAAPGHPFSYELDFAPREATLLLKGASDPILLREGSLFLSGPGVTFSKFKVQSQKSSLILDGSMRQGEFNLLATGSVDLRTVYAVLQLPLFSDSVRTPLEEIQGIAGSVDLRLNLSGRMEDAIHAIREGELRLRGISLQHKTIPGPLTQIEGRILFSSQQIRIEGLKGRLGKSSLTFSSISTRVAPSAQKAKSTKVDPRAIRRFSFHLSSPYLDLDPLFPESQDKSPVSFERLREWLSSWVIEGWIHIEQGKYRTLECRDVKLEMKTEDRKLLIHPFQLKANGGDLWGEGWVEAAPRGIRFEIKPRLSNLDLVDFFRTFPSKGEEEKMPITGRIHVDRVELRGEGENFQAIKESLNGGLRLELENGVIERGNILSKIFSILNVSQLFKGRLPDLKTKGLPYHRISATMQIKDGITSTDDFLVDSDAMRITVIGKVDLGKDLIDAKVGVHPLGTVDIVLSNIPIAGYILTGKEKAFLSYVYEVKGNLGDPRVEAIPFKSMGEGALGIFKRLLETPLRPFQKSDSQNK